MKYCQTYEADFGENIFFASISLSCDLQSDFFNEIVAIAKAHCGTLYNQSVDETTGTSKIEFTFSSSYNREAFIGFVEEFIDDFKTHNDTPTNTVFMTLNLKILFNTFLDYCYNLEDLIEFLKLESGSDDPNEYIEFLIQSIKDDSLPEDYKQITNQLIVLFAHTTYGAYSDPVFRLNLCNPETDLLDEAYEVENYTLYS